MSPRKLRLLADCLEIHGFYPDTDRKRWADDLRGMAKGMEGELMDANARRQLQHFPTWPQMSGSKDPRDP